MVGMEVAVGEGNQRICVRISCWGSSLAVCVGAQLFHKSEECKRHLHLYYTGCLGGGGSVENSLSFPGKAVKYWHGVVDALWAHERAVVRICLCSPSPWVFLWWMFGVWEGEQAPLKTFWGTPAVRIPLTVNCPVHWVVAPWAAPLV